MKKLTKDLRLGKVRSTKFLVSNDTTRPETNYYNFLMLLPARDSGNDFFVSKISDRSVMFPGTRIGG